MQMAGSMAAILSTMWARPQTRRTHPGNPVTSRNYAGSRERDPSLESLASLDQTPVEPARPDLPSTSRRVGGRVTGRFDTSVLTRLGDSSVLRRVEDLDGTASHARR